MPLRKRCISAYILRMRHTFLVLFAVVVMRAGAQTIYIDTHLANSNPIKKELVGNSRNGAKQLL
jgi:hypothetical protein